MSAETSALRIQPLAHATGSEVDFGAEIPACDLTELSEPEFAALEKAVLTHHVVVVRGQAELSPQHQLELTRRFDPQAQTYGHGHDKELLRKSVLTQDLISIPDVPQVQLLGNGTVRDHEGLPEVQLNHPTQRTFHRNPLSELQETRNLTRFYRWHIDAALYRRHPPKVTTLLALQVPQSRKQTVVYDDGSGDELPVSLGTTAFVSGYAAFARLSDEQKDWALRTRARYAPHPYVWMRDARARSDGLGLVSEGRELPRSKLPDLNPDDIMTLPLVWINPLTGAPALQVHPFCVEALITDGKSQNHLSTCRHQLHQLMRPAIAPNRIYAHDWQPGDLVIFNNRGVWHSVVGALRSSDVRIYHQCNLAASEPPIGPNALS